MDNKVICTFCGEEYSPELSRCPECGEKNKNVVKKSLDDDILSSLDDFKFDDLDYDDGFADDVEDDYDNDDEDDVPVRRSRSRNQSDADKIPVWLKTLILIVAGMAIIIAALFMMFKMGMISFGKAFEEEPSTSVSMPVETSQPSTDDQQNSEDSQSGGSLVIEDPATTEAPAESSPSPSEIPAEPDEELPSEITEPDPVEPEPVVECTSITINRDDISFFTRGEVYNFNATTEPSSAYEHVVWSSSDPTVVKVDSNGSCTAVNGGTAYVTATCGDKTATCIVRCQFEAEEFLSMSKEDITLKTLGETAKLSVQDVSVTDEGNIKWSSSDDLIASVDDNGTVTAMGKGTATITAVLDGKKAECVVRVDIPSITNSQGQEISLTMNHTDVTLFAVGESVQMKVVASDGSEIDTSSLTWVSKDESVATVDATGLVKAVGNGNTTIYTTVDGENVSCIVRVSIR